MSQWKCKINIKQHLSGDCTKESLVKALNGVIIELSHVPSKYCPEDLAEQFEWALEDVENDNVDSQIEAFNDLLRELYDWADYHRIWTGL